MAERQTPRVERLSGKVEARLLLPVDWVVENRVAGRREMHANLMRAPRFEAKEQLGVFGKGFAYLVVRDGRFAVADDSIL